VVAVAVGLAGPPDEQRGTGLFGLFDRPVEQLVGPVPVRDGKVTSGSA